MAYGEAPFELQMLVLAIFVIAGLYILARFVRLVANWGRGDQPIEQYEPEREPVHVPTPWTTEQEQADQRQSFELWRNRDTNIFIGKHERFNPISKQWEVVND